MIGLRLKVLNYIEASEQVDWDELFVGSASGISRKSSPGRSVMTCGKMIPVRLKIVLCFCWLDMPCHTTMLDDNVVTNTDLCVRAL